MKKKFSVEKSKSAFFRASNNQPNLFLSDEIKKNNKGFGELNLKDLKGLPLKLYKEYIATCKKLRFLKTLNTKKENISKSRKQRSPKSCSTENDVYICLLIDQNKFLINFIKALTAGEDIEKFFEDNSVDMFSAMNISKNIKSILIKFIKAHHIKIGSEDKFNKYDLALMSRLPHNNPQLAEAGKIYLSEEGDYVVRDSNGKVQEGKLGDTIDLTDLVKRQEDPKLKNAILDFTSKRGHDCFNSRHFDYLVTEKMIQDFDNENANTPVKNSSTQLNRM